MGEKIVLGPDAHVLMEQSSLMPSGAWEAVWYISGDGRHLGVKLDFHVELMHPKFFSPEQVIGKDGSYISRFDAFIEDFKDELLEMFTRGCE